VHAGVVTGSVRSTVVRDNTNLGPVGPGATGLTTVAVTAAGESGVRAAVDILSRVADDLVLVDTLTIAHGLSGTESPAGTAVLLVTDILHGVTVGPLGARIEGLGGSGDLSSRVVLDPPGVSVEVVEVDTKKTTSLALGHTGDSIVRSLPEVLLVVDLTDHAGAHSDLLSKSGCGEKSKNDSNLVHCQLKQ